MGMLPSLITLCNLLCGFLAIFVASRDPSVKLPFDWSPLTVASLFIFLGMVFDGLDGRVARMTHNTSDLGEQLDSMADMVTFGVAPAFIAVQLAGVKTPFLSAHNDSLLDRTTLAIAAIYVACAALRLARFNIEAHKPTESDHMSFKGLPSPGAAGTVAALALLHQKLVAGYPHAEGLMGQAESTWGTFISEVGITGVMLLVALAMVSRLRYVHLLNRYFRGRAKFSRLAAIVVVALLLFVNPQGSFAALFVLYAISAPMLWLFRTIVGRPPAPATTTSSGSSAARVTNVAGDGQSSDPVSESKTGT
jgi:CDP-diacylglycerol--serine O-phosphatidyltransferase